MEYYLSKEWKGFLEKSLRELLRKESLPYTRITPSRLPGSAGVYLISEIIKGKEVALYVGRTKNLSNRLYRNHLMGDLTNARLKKYMTQDSAHSCFKDKNLAKAYIRENCFVRWVLESDIRKRGALEGYFTARLFPKYGISEEH